MQRITDASGASLKPFACDSVTSGPRYLPIVKLLELGAFILSPVAVCCIGCSSHIEKQSVDNDKPRDSANNASEVDTPFF